ncbi:hypothetical protein [Ligaoa zhengdingensis]
MKKFGAMVMALVLACSLAGCAASSKLPVNGVAMLKEGEDSIEWFAMKSGELIETLNEKGRQEGYPELQLLEDYESPEILPESHSYAVSQGPYTIPQIYIEGIEARKPENAEYTGCIYRINISTDVDDEAEAEAIGYYLDEIVGIFSPKNKDKIEKELGMFAAVKGYKELIDGNVLYKRSDDEVCIYANPDAAEAITLGDKTPPPHLKKPE